jgi:uncharacterized membrane protein YkoI
MKSSLKMLGCIAASAILSIGSWSMAADEAIDLDKTPAPVQASIKTLLGDKKFDSLEKEDQKGAAVYEVEYKVNGTGYAALINETGDVIQHEVDIDPSAVPQNILDAAKKTHDGATIDEASFVNADGKIYYEFELKAGDQTYEVKVSTKGKVNHDAAKKDADDKDTKDDKK